MIVEVHQGLRLEGGEGRLFEVLDLRGDYFVSLKVKIFSCKHSNTDWEVPAIHSKSGD